MAWPTLQDYNEAIQNPRLAFADPDLRVGKPELNQLGLPRPIAGNFACVYKIQAGGQRWAARCFSNEVSDQQKRYEAISTYLKKVALPYTVQFTFQSAGIKVLGNNYPLLKMEWVQGESLSTFVGKSIAYPDTLFSLAKVWVVMMADLKTASIAHGDLQHGNVVVVEDQLRLIDYDGMFVPGLAGKQSNECGHRNYQLPSRTGWDYGPYLDNFSAWVIYVSLVSLAVHPELWSEYRGGDECLIFRKEDFVRPESSALLRDLNSSSNTQLRFLVELFVSLFNLSPQDVPSLDGNLTKVSVVPPKGWWVDHVENPRQSDEKNSVSVNRMVEAEAFSSDPAWIVDSLMEDKPAEPIVFQGQTKEIRILIIGSMALLILTRLLVEIPVSELLVMTTCVFGLNLLLCFVRYKRDPSFAEFETFNKESKVFIRQVREHQTLIDSISAERLLIQGELIKNERAISEEKNLLVGSLQTEQIRAQEELNSQLQALNERRRNGASLEVKKLDSIQKTLGNQVTELGRTISSLNQKEADEVGRVVASLQDYHVQSYLRNHSVAASSIPGIGAAYKSRLTYNGFTSAADIDWRVNKVNGIGPSRQASLLRWKQGLENEARRSAPTLKPQERLAIESKYRQERQSLETEKQRLQAQFDSQVAGVRQHFADFRQSLNKEDQQLKAADAQKRVRFQQEHDAEVLTLDKKVLAARNHKVPAMAELAQKLQTAQKEIFALRWQSAKREKEGRRFITLRFRNYLRNMISS